MNLPEPSPTIAELREALDSGATTVREIVSAALDRIEALDRHGPMLNAVIELNPDALAIADALDAELAAGSSRGPLHGIPILVKDNIATGDAMGTTAGSLALVGLKATADSTVAARLRAAGMVIIGKTNLSEWANIRSRNSSSGWSGRGGQTLNPYQLDRNPSGSSSGSGVAAAAGYVPVTIGTETNGSIISPAGHCGIVGIKPTVGLVSRTGVIPISHSQDTIGPMARTVADAAAVLTALAGTDSRDSASTGVWPLQATGVETALPSYPIRPESGVETVDYTTALDPDGLRGARIGVVRQLTGQNPHADAVFEEALAMLAASGAILVDPADIPSLADDGWKADLVPVMEWELKAGLAGYFAAFLPEGAPMATLADVIAFNEANAAAELPWFGQDILLSSDSRTDLDDPEYLAAVMRLQAAGRSNGIDAALKAHDLDALVAPTNAPASKIDLVNGDRSGGMGASTPAAIAGYPLLTLPAGYRHGLPIGITFLGTAWSELDLIRLAYGFEQAAKIWRAPEFHPAGVMPPEA